MAAGDRRRVRRRSTAVRVSLRRRLDTQLAGPRGRAGAVLLDVLNGANGGLNRAAPDALALSAGDRAAGSLSVSR